MQRWLTASAPMYYAILRAVVNNSARFMMVFNLPQGTHLVMPNDVACYIIKIWGTSCVGPTLYCKPVKLHFFANCCEVSGVTPVPGTWYE